MGLIPKEAEVAYSGTVRLYNVESSHRAGYRLELQLAVEDDYKTFKGMTRRKKGRAGIIFRAYFVDPAEKCSRMIEAYFAGWSVSNSSGAKARFDLQSEDDFAFFRELPAVVTSPETAMKWTLTLVEIDDDGETVDQRQREHVESMKGGPLCRKAAIMCSDPVFRRFVSEQTKKGQVTPDDAAEFIRDKCGVSSRRELDHDERASGRFHRWVTRPFAIWHDGPPR